MHLKDLISELGRELGLTNLINGDHQAAELMFNNRIEVIIEPSLDGRAAHLHARIGELTADTPVEVYRALLRGHLLAVATRGYCFTMMDHSDDLFLFRNFQLDSTQPHDLVKALEDLVEVVEQWETYLENPTQEETTPEEPTAVVAHMPDLLQV